LNISLLSAYSITLPRTEVIDGERHCSPYA
jgi:hypothetical protein